jgi:hypothetical protein
MTQAEVTRWVEHHDRQHEQMDRVHAELVTRREYELTMRNMADDIAETKETLRWMQRLLVTQLVAFAAGIILYLVNTVSP